MRGRLTGWSAALGLVVAGCGGSEETTTPPPAPEPQIQCEDPVFFDLTLTGVVRDGDAFAAGADVRIEERNWEPGTVHGSAVTDANGRYSIDATALPIIEGCWGWATGFYVVAEQGDRQADWGINSVITGAWQRGETTADLSDIPLDLAD